MDALNKSLDLLIDELFADESEAVAKANMIKDEDPAKTTADAAVKAAPKAEKDEARGAGRPDQISDVPQVDTDGSRSGDYDKDIAAKQEDAKKKEDDQVKPSKELVKKSFSDAEYEEYQALKKAQSAAQTEEALRKSEARQADLIKSVIAEALSGVKAENETLKKSMAEQNDLIKAMANKPQKGKAITNMIAVEKFQKSEGRPSLSKSEILDVAEDMVSKGQLPLEIAIEIDDSGSIYDPEMRSILEREVARRYR